MIFVKHANHDYETQYLHYHFSHFLGNSILLNAQEVHFIEQSRTENSNGISCYASNIDRLNKPYVYTANLQQGLKIYKIENPASPELVAEIGIQNP